MRVSGWMLRIVVAGLAIVSWGGARSAVADTFQIFDLGSTTPYSEIYGLDSSGNVALKLVGSPACASLSTYCYAVNFEGTITSYSDTVPVLDYDNGGACNNRPLDLGFPIHGCNNGRVAIAGKTYGYGLFVGPDLVDAAATFAQLTEIYVGPVYSIRMNGSGDIAFTTGYENYLAYDVSGHVPEPGTLGLVGSGLVGIAGLVRRLRR